MLFSTVGQILEAAKAKGMTDAQVMELAGRHPVTLWRWRGNPKMRIKLDDGMIRLLEALNG